MPQSPPLPDDQPTAPVGLPKRAYHRPHLEDLGPLAAVTGTDDLPYGDDGGTGGGPYGDYSDYS